MCESLDQCKEVGSSVSSELASYVASWLSIHDSFVSCIDFFWIIEFKQLFSRPKELCSLCVLLL